jgi:hypothetical protein
MPCESREESIPSLQLTAGTVSLQRLLAVRRRVRGRTRRRRPGGGKVGHGRRQLSADPLGSGANMTLDNLANIGEFVGALAVVVSLLYLAVQIRQNSQLIRVSTSQAAGEWFLAGLSIAAQSSQTAKMLTHGLADLRQLSEDERTQFFILMQMFFAGFSEQYLNYQHGAIMEYQWRDTERIARWWLNQAGVQTWWHTQRTMLNPDFVSHVERELSNPKSAA